MREIPMNFRENKKKEVNKVKELTMNFNDELELFGIKYNHYNVSIPYAPQEEFIIHLPEGYAQFLVCYLDFEFTKNRGVYVRKRYLLNLISQMVIAHKSGKPIYFREVSPVLLDIITDPVFTENTRKEVRFNIAPPFKFPTANVDLKLAWRKNTDKRFKIKGGGMRIFLDIMVKKANNGTKLD